MEKLFRPKDYFKPMNISEALAILDRYKGRAKPLAGGTDLLNDKSPEVEYIVDITHLGLAYVREDGDGVKIGSCATIRQLGDSQILKKEPYHMLTEAAEAFVDVKIRNVATVGGNICNAIPSGEALPPLIALDSKVKLANQTGGERVVSLEDFFLGARRTVMVGNELLTEIQIPTFPVKTVGKYLRTQKSLVKADTNLLSVSVRLTLGEQNVCNEARIVLGGGVSPIPLRVKKAENVLVGKILGDKEIGEAARICGEEISPRPGSLRASPWYRKQVTPVYVRRALKHALKKV